MKKITFHYYKSKGLAGFLIRARLSTIFSHVAMEFENGELYHSDPLNGTHLETTDDYSNPYCSTTIEVTEAGYESALAFVRSQLGTGYDFKAILGFIITKRFESSKNYFCSELGRLVFERATGIEIELYNLLTPGQLRLVTETYRLK